MQVWELVARESIRDLVARYNANGDSGRLPQMLSVFAEDAVLELVSEDGAVRSHEGVQAISAFFTGASEQLRAAGGAAIPRHLRHFTATHQIDVVDEERATGRCYYLVVVPAGLDHWGRYVDEYCVRAGRWCITRRRVSVDGRAPGSLVPPL